MEMGIESLQRERPNLGGRKKVPLTRKPRLNVLACARGRQK